MESRLFEEVGRGWADTAHTTEQQPGFCSVVRIGRSGRGWADTAHATELQSCFCSVVRIGRSGREWADTAHATELQSVFCSVVRIGRSGRGWADTAHTTELQSVFCSVVRIGRPGREWADTAHATELQPGFCRVVQGPGLFCVSAAFSRLNPALPVSDPGRSVYRGVRGGRGWEVEPIPSTYFCRDIAAAEEGGALTQLPIQAFSKDSDLAHF